MAPRRLVSNRFDTEDGGTVQMVVYEVGVTERFPDGVRYRPFYARDRRVVVGYDNHHPKGHHRHVEGREEPYAFESVERLVSNFLADVQKSGGKRT